jgi:hypothetical protein
VVVPAGGDLAELGELADRARDYARNSKAANTLPAYESDLRQFGAWCERRGLVAFPATAETVAYYLPDHAGVLPVCTLRRRLAAQLGGPQRRRHANPTTDPAVRIMWDGTGRTHGISPESREAAVTEVVAALVAPLGVARSKTDQEGEDNMVGTAYAAAALGRHRVAAAEGRCRGPGVETAAACHCPHHPGEANVAEVREAREDGSALADALQLGADALVGPVAVDAVVASRRPLGAPRAGHARGANPSAQSHDRFPSAGPEHRRAVSAMLSNRPCPGSKKSVEIERRGSAARGLAGDG